MRYINDRCMAALLLLFAVAGLAGAQYQSDTLKTEQQQFPWPMDKRCAVSLTFDDARLTQIDKGIPLLNKYGVKATFYISPNKALERLDGWKKAIDEGHEIGNHSMTHPCTGSYPFSRNNALENYTLDKIAADISQADTFIQKYLGIKARSFAYPCGQKFVGRGKNLKTYIPLVADRFFSARGWLGENSNDPLICDMSQLLAMESDGKTFEELKSLVEKTAAAGRWLILAGHEMDAAGRQTTRLSSLDSLCQYARDPRNGIWIDTLTKIAEYIHEQRKYNNEL